MMHCTKHAGALYTVKCNLQHSAQPSLFMYDSFLEAGGRFELIFVQQMTVKELRHHSLIMGVLGRRFLPFFGRETSLNYKSQEPMGLLAT